MNAMQIITRMEGKSRNIFVYADSGRVCSETIASYIIKYIESKAISYLLHYVHESVLHRLHGLTLIVHSFIVAWLIVILE